MPASWSGESTAPTLPRLYENVNKPQITDSLMPSTFLDPHTDWRARLAHVVQTVREMSTQIDPQEMVRAYGSRMRTLIPMDRHVSLSRRGLEHPQVRITRSDLWKEQLDPWKNPDKLPVFTGGL